MASSKQSSIFLSIAGLALISFMMFYPFCEIVEIPNVEVCAAGTFVGVPPHLRSDVPSCMILRLGEEIEICSSILENILDLK